MIVKMKIKSNGFTLIELIFTLGIVSILLILSTSISSVFIKHQVNTQTSKLFHTMQYARSEAIKRGQTVVLCPTQDFHLCSPKWDKGYMVFVPAQNQTQDIKNILRIETIPHHLTVNSKAITAIKYSSDGSSLTRATIHVINHQNQCEQKIVLYDSGRSRIENACSNV